jgi:hypothetical protein
MRWLCRSHQRLSGDLPAGIDPHGANEVWKSSQVTLDATTGSGNSGTTVGGIYNPLGTVTLQNGSTVTGNTPRNCDGPIEGGTCGP